MKIHLLPVGKEFQPASEHRSPYPDHNKDYGIEQDFHKFLLRHGELTAGTPEEADWHYLPIYWVRYHVNHDYGKTGRPDLQREADRVILDDRRTFTICQGPPVDLGRSTIFWASRRTHQGLDVPLLCLAHRVHLAYRIPLIRPSKRYLASFVGRYWTHPLRQEIADALSERDDVLMCDRKTGTRFFVQAMLDSYVALCPRGVGGSSYRFFEAMQLGVVPFLIGDLDTRPFKRYIDWEEVSLFSSTASGLNERLDSLGKPDLLAMGKRAASLLRSTLTFGRWCPYVIRELERLVKGPQEDWSE